MVHMASSPTESSTDCLSGKPPVRFHPDAMLPLSTVSVDETACCGPPPGPRSSWFELPGYAVCHYVKGFCVTDAGNVPIIRNRTGFRDWIGTVKTRLGIGRDQYRVAPGVYATGKPDRQSPVLVSANYKLSFDVLRKALGAVNAWVLVVDTRGINVWCAAGKKLFSTAEVVSWVKRSGLERIVDHRKLILPQLSATGVSAHQVKKQSGFEVIWGPVRAADIPSFIENGMKALPSMRRVDFSFVDRLVLIPVEIVLLAKHLWIAMTIAFILSGIGPDVFSLSAVWNRGLTACLALAAGIVAGTVMVPLLLPVLPFRRFSLNGAGLGVISGLAFPLSGEFSLLESVALILASGVFGSFLAMNFTGSTPYTSPSGVEKEMRAAIPVQVVGVLIAAGLWVAAAFV